ncbi:MAG: hypothetical protein JW809_08685 [Pirellulales bacterium]|nr:hypothetical protein [Pirellulales bacterium]
MTRSAKLTSIDAVRELAAALRAFGEEMTGALDHLELSVRRAREWIQHDRKEYWQHEVRRGGEKVGEARADLEKALNYRGVSGQAPSCRQERAMLEAAVRRARIAEEKIEVVRHWTHAIDHAAIELAGGQAPAVDWLQSELPRALAALARMTEALESYAEATGQAEGPSSPASVVSEGKADENVGPEHAGGEASPGDEGSQPG